MTRAWTIRYLENGNTIEVGNRLQLSILRMLTQFDDSITHYKHSVFLTYPKLT